VARSSGSSFIASSNNSRADFAMRQYNIVACRVLSSEGPTGSVLKDALELEFFCADAVRCIPVQRLLWRLEGRPWDLTLPDDGK
jgi:hypothetical protein